MQALRYLLLPAPQEGDGGTNVCWDDEFVKEGEKDENYPTSLRVPTELRLSPEDIAKIYKVEMDSTMMEQIIQAMHLWTSSISTFTVLISGDKDKDEDEDGDERIITTRNNHDHMERLNFIYRTMYSITTCGRFSLNISFMDDRHKCHVCCILDKLRLEYEASHGISSSTLDELQGGFIYNGNDIGTLSDLYNVHVAKTCH